MFNIKLSAVETFEYSITCLPASKLSVNHVLDPIISLLIRIQERDKLLQNSHYAFFFVIRFTYQGYSLTTLKIMVSKCAYMF